MQLQNVTFVNWLVSHQHKESEERWLRELYPWPVLARVDCDTQYVGLTQHIIYAGVEYEVTLKSIQWQPQHGTFKYRLLVESEGIGWHARSFYDEYDMCGTDLPPENDTRYNIVKRGEIDGQKKVHTGTNHQ